MEKDVLRKIGCCKHYTLFAFDTIHIITSDCNDGNYFLVKYLIHSVNIRRHKRFNPQVRNTNPLKSLIISLGIEILVLGFLFRPTPVFKISTLIFFTLGLD